MRLSRLFARTLREAPAEAEAPSHRLLLRAAFIRQVMSGVYAFLPLGLRTLDKISRIVREEMDAAGAQEVLLPVLVPAEPWKVTGRWQAYGPDMFKLADRNERDLGLTPTHEEVITPIVASEFKSYRDLPVNLYQIQWKFRDEPRPRSGLLRGREFLMKDAYSFDRDGTGLKESYAKMVEAYKAIFDRCGLDYWIVEADPGLIGGDVNHEFMATADVGEDLFVHCTSCDYAANIEAAVAGEKPESEEPLEEMTEIETPGKSSIRDVGEFLGAEDSRMLKTLAYMVGDEPAYVLIPGDRDLNEGKLRRALAPAQVRMFEEEDFKERGLQKGFIGPHLKDVRRIADHRVRSGRNWIVGANKQGFHATGANLERDFEVERWEDLAVVAEGDPCPRCGSPLALGRAIEVGHTFQLGTRYTIPLEATYTEENGEQQPYVMGCYGIGVSRIVSAVAEQHSDEAGLAWPKAVAPYQAVVIVANRDAPEVTAEADRIYSAFLNAGIESVIDDREGAAGVKFNDADLIGYPLQVVVGRRGLETGEVDMKLRETGEKSKAAVADVVDRAFALLGAAP